MATVNSINDNGEYGKEQLANGNHFDAIHNILKGEIKKEEPTEIKWLIENGVCDKSYQEDGKFNEPVSSNYEEYLGKSKPSLTRYVSADDHQEVDQIKKEIKENHTSEDNFECDDLITINADLKTEDGIDIVYEDIKPPLNTHPNTIANIVPTESSIDFEARPQQNSTVEEDETDVGRYNEKGFLCNFCSKSFTISSALKYHERTHTGEKPFQCNFCSKSYKQSGDLKNHERTHTGEKPFQCNICPKSFTRGEALKIHRRTHSGEKPFQCKFCPKCFSQNGALKYHEKTHTGERPFQCNLCLKTYMQSSVLKIHKRTHTGEKPFQCNICLKSFARGDGLKIHQRTHTGEKPFQCDFCQKSFKHGNALKIHRRTHTGEKSFQCNFCPKSFTRNGAMKIHERSCKFVRNPSYEVMT